MRIFHSTAEYADSGMGASAVALGFFDGVHAGHRRVIERCVKDSGKCASVVLTFRESPAAALKKGKPRLLSQNSEKARLLGELGVDAVIFADFESMMALSAEAFVEEILARQLGARAVFCGYNYRFGRGGAGDTDTLCALCGEHGIAVAVCEPVSIDGEGVSSTRIRDCVESGEIERANRMLGRELSIGGSIGRGNHIGSALGFPTVNIPIPADAVVPRFGVYQSRILIDGRKYRGATNIGVHPTVGENDAPLCETFILGYDGGELYGREAECRLVRFVRPERRFGSVEELKEQVKRDIESIDQANKTQQ